MYRIQNLTKPLALTGSPFSDPERDVDSDNEDDGLSDPDYYSTINSNTLQPIKSHPVRSDSDQNSDSKVISVHKHKRLLTNNKTRFYIGESLVHTLKNWVSSYHLVGVHSDPYNQERESSRIPPDGGTCQSNTRYDMV